VFALYTRDVNISLLVTWPHSFVDDMKYITLTLHTHADDKA
jgi:hypothetical protein